MHNSLQLPISHNPFAFSVSPIGINCATQCPDGRYGESCENVCRCLNNSSCDPHTGRCVCSRGWTGADCSQPCPSGTFGLGCKEQCATSPQDNTTCDHVTGEYVCQPGYIGATCEHPCPQRTFGANCVQHCKCEHGGECNHVTGQCQCVPGYTGPTCEEPCPMNYYGLNCSQTCSCQHGAQCRRNDGFCHCSAGFMGTHCEDGEFWWRTAFFGSCVLVLIPCLFRYVPRSVCPEGTYGQFCMEFCACPSKQFVCHAIKGCICRAGFIGEDCLTPVSSALGRAPEDHSSSTAGVAWGVIIVLILCGVIVLVMMHYRRRVRNLKTVIADVEFIANPQLQTNRDRNHFDNPVYAMRDNAQLLRSVPPVKPTNLERLKRGLQPNGRAHCDGDEPLASVASTTSSDSGGGGAAAAGRAGAYSIDYNSEMTQKNLNADLTNPNLYHSIDDNSEEHVYDEITQKEGYKDPGK